MSHRKSVRRRRERTLRRSGARPWSEAPHLWPVVATTLFGAFTGGPAIRSCVHLDGLPDLSDLDRVALWSPAIVRSLVCAECFQGVLAELDGGDNLVIPTCDACGEFAPDVVTFTTAFEQPNALLQVLGAFCPACLEPPEAA